MLKLCKWALGAAVGVLVMALGALVAGCGSSGDHKPQSQGAPYEIVVVADHSAWDGPVGDTLRHILQAREPMINREEPRFRVLRTLPEGFRRLVMKHPNVLIVSIDAKHSEPVLEVHNDLYARPQIVLVAKAPDEVSMVELIATNAENIPTVLEYTERQRDVALAEAHGSKKIKALIEQKFGFEMSVGPSYTVRSEGEIFVWLSYEMPTASQGIIIYDYPFTGKHDFEKASILGHRDEFVARIPGENPGSHMATNHDMIDLIYKKINGRQWAETHGFWKVEGDFMGGPFVNYTTLDEARRMVIAIDTYVYAPDHRSSQRNFKRQLEHYIYTVKFPVAKQ